MLYLANKLGPGEYEVVGFLTSDQASMATGLSEREVQKETTEDKLALIEKILAKEGISDILVN